ncbi:Flp pilus assembly protein CpaB [Marinobacter adhaerens]|uniref:Pilus assembly, Flp-type CpaB n=1 Tax=Marinobacter adhaerens (strain DSM 23420 / HP15) TaxID=225937 RepID=E4PRW8_MARAH|nr:Flp pilus assembly protein CpaB [Marinobacter adhaerens]ADQ00003.1 pilus assembly, Flp-type CpaB [Marinobacter adhaerens HP15]MBW4980203.1 Flp pilus assembly protein CpaB [Marinobacter adhaerens]
MNFRFVHAVPALVLSLIAISLAVYGLLLDTPGTARQMSSLASEGQVQRPTEEPELPSFTYVIAKQTLQAGEVLERTAVMAVESTEELEGLVELESLPFGEPLTARVDKGLPISRSLLELQNPVQQLLERGHKAVAVELTNLSSVGGLIRPGDSVDIFASFSEEDGASAVSTRLFSAIPVLAVRGATSVTDDLDDDERRRNPTMVLAIPESDMSKLTLALSESRLTFAATKPIEEDPVSTVTAGVDNEAMQINPEPLVAFTTDIRPKQPAESATNPQQRPKQEAVEEQRREILVFEGSSSRSVYVQ